MHIGAVNHSVRVCKVACVDRGTRGSARLKIKKHRGTGICGESGIPLSSVRSCIGSDEMRPADAEEIKVVSEGVPSVRPAQAAAGEPSRKTTSEDAVVVTGAPVGLAVAGWGVQKRRSDPAGKSGLCRRTPRLRLRQTLPLGFGVTVKGVAPPLLFVAYQISTICLAVVSTARAAPASR